MGAVKDSQPINPLITARPYEYRIPTNYDASKPLPLIVLLHGFGADGVTQDLLFGWSQLVDQFGFLYAYPDGTQNSMGKRFWNATEVCCDTENTGVDDVAYIDAVIDDMAGRFNVDPKRIYVTGHSNGGFMSHRYACDRANRVTAIMSLAGAAYADTSKCKASEPVAVLEVHGDMDDEVPYGGGSAGGITLPSAEQTVAGWAAKNGCGATADHSAAPIDVDGNLPGNETQIERFTGCWPGGAAELWTIVGGGHVPALNRPGWGQEVFGFLFPHVKPGNP